MPPLPSTPSRPTSIEHLNLDRRAYDILKRMIAERRLLPGVKIPQEELAAELGISRTPLINALKLLEQEHLVEAVPRRGFIVREFSRADLIAIFEVREVLEGLAARKAAENLQPAQADRLARFFRTFAGKKRISDTHAYAEEDRAFHAFLAELGGNRFLSDTLAACNVIKFSYLNLAAEGLVRPPEQTLPEHRAIIEAVLGHDATGAERAMRRHLGASLAVLRASPEA